MGQDGEGRKVENDDVDTVVVGDGDVDDNLDADGKQKIATKTMRRKWWWEEERKKRVVRGGTGSHQHHPQWQEEEEEEHHRHPY